MLEWDLEVHYDGSVCGRRRILIWDKACGYREGSMKGGDGDGEELGERVGGGGEWCEVGRNSGRLREKVAWV